jgi:hypothetical protein
MHIHIYLTCNFPYQYINLPFRNLFNFWANWFLLLETELLFFRLLRSKIYFIDLRLRWIGVREFAISWSHFIFAEVLADWRTLVIWTSFLVYWDFSHYYVIDVLLLVRVQKEGTFDLVLGEEGMLDVTLGIYFSKSLEFLLFCSGFFWRRLPKLFIKYIWFFCLWTQILHLHFPLIIRYLFRIERMLW